MSSIQNSWIKQNLYTQILHCGLRIKWKFINQLTYTPNNKHFKGDPSGSYGKKLALVIAKSPLLRKQVESIPGFSFKEFVSWANNTGTIELFGGNDRTEKDITDLNSADYKDHVVGVSAALKNYKQAKEQHAAKQA